MPDFNTSSWELNLGPHVCVVSTLSLEPSSLPLTVHIFKRDALVPLCVWGMQDPLTLGNSVGLKPQQGQVCEVRIESAEDNQSISLLILS